MLAGMQYSVSSTWSRRAETDRYVSTLLSVRHGIHVYINIMMQQRQTLSCMVFALRSRRPTGIDWEMVADDDDKVTPVQSRHRPSKTEYRSNSRYTASHQWIGDPAISTSMCRVCTYKGESRQVRGCGTVGHGRLAGTRRLLFQPQHTCTQDTRWRSTARC